MRRIEWPGEPADARERRRITAQLGRDPRGEVAVVARCEYGLPAVVRTNPRLEDGTPFPTLFYLVCPIAVRAIGRLEAAGEMRRHQDALAEDPDLREAYRQAHERYIARRDSLERLDEPMSAGGMPTRVKCLHALYAHELAEGNPVGARVRAEVEPLGCPGDCVEEHPDGSFGRVAAHPAFGGKKKRRA